MGRLYLCETRAPDKRNWTLAVGLWDLVNSTQDSNFTLFAAASVLIALPITLLFVFLRVCWSMA